MADSPIGTTTTSPEEIQDPSTPILDPENNLYICPSDSDDEDQVEGSSSSSDQDRAIYMQQIEQFKAYEHNGIDNEFTFDMSDQDITQLQPQKITKRGKKKGSVSQAIRKRPLNPFEVILVGGFLSAFIKRNQLLNPYSNQRVSQRSVKQTTAYTDYNRIVLFIRLLNLPPKESCMKTWWNIVQPNSLRLGLQKFADAGYNFQSIRQHFTSLYRFLWLPYDAEFQSKMGITITSSLNGDLNSLSQWYVPNMKLAITRGKQHTKSQNHWERISWIKSSAVTNQLVKFEEELRNEESVSFTYLRQILTYCYFVTIVPGRMQNMKLLVLPSRGNLSVDDLKGMLEEHNSQYTLDELANLKRTGFIFSEPIEGGGYHTIWLDYKTSDSFGVQERTFTHPCAILAFRLYFEQRGVENNSFLQNMDRTPLKTFKDFDNITKKAFKKTFSVKDYRMFIANSFANASPEKRKYIQEKMLHSKKTEDDFYIVDSPQKLGAQNERYLNDLGDQRSVENQEAVMRFQQFLRESPKSEGDKLIDLVDSFINQSKTKNGDDDKSSSSSIQSSHRKRKLEHQFGNVDDDVDVVVEAQRPQKQGITMCDICKQPYQRTRKWDHYNYHHRAFQCEKCGLVYYGNKNELCKKHNKKFEKGEISDDEN